MRDGNMKDCGHGGNGKDRSCSQGPIVTSGLHTAWLHFIRYCTELGYGEIEKLKIQDGMPMMAEITVKKIKFTP
jgi:hypothetical protein